MTNKFNKTFKKILTENIDIDDFSILGIDKDRKIVKICAWCDRDKTVTKQWVGRGYTTSHGTCESCYNKMMAELDD